MAAEASDVFYDCPLQFICIEEDGKCHLAAHAVKMLNELQGKLAVVGIAGLYRTGKSFLLNRLLGKQQGFEVGPTVNPCTKGLWIWGQPVQLAPDYHCIFLDTEGLGSSGRTTTCDMQIFTLCILLSSLFIYNSMGAVDEMAIDDLHLVLQVAKHLHAKSHEPVQAKSEGVLFPSLLWVLRDFHLRLVDARDRPITPQQYLENALAPIAGQEKRNEIRAVIKSVFTDRDCAAMVRPVLEEEDLRHVERLPFASLRPQFRKQVDEFTQRVYAAVRPKMIDGAVVTGPMLVGLASEYCKAINSNAVPTIRSTWRSVVQHQLQRLLREALNIYRSEMDAKALRCLPLNEDVLYDLHSSARIQAFQVLEEPQFGEEDPALREAQANLSDKIKQLYEHAQSRNGTASREQCQRLAEQLYEQLIEKRLNKTGRGGYDSVEELMQDWDKLQKSYHERAQGPAGPEILSSWLFPRMTDSVTRLVNDRKKAERGQYCDLTTITDRIWGMGLFSKT